MKSELTNEILKRVDTVGEKVSEVISVLADKIGVGAEHFWPIFVQQQAYEGITSLVICILSITIPGVTAYIFFKLHLTAEQNDRYYGDGYGVISAVLSFISVISFVITLLILPDTFPKILNPEYYALKEIINMVK